MNTFQFAAPSHNWAGLWRHPRDNQANYNRLEYWVDMARLAERGLLDGIFIADVFGIYDVYGGNADAALSSASQAPQLDPTPAISAMAMATSHIGFGAAFRRRQGRAGRR